MKEEIKTVRTIKCKTCGHWMPQKDCKNVCWNCGENLTSLKK